jgi:sugar lactone lactonase YvrE
VIVEVNEIMRNFKQISICVFVLAGLAVANAEPVKLWETNEIFKSPESVVYDGTRGFLYISNCNGSLKDGLPYGEQCISKANLKGEIIKFDWIENLTKPTGICINDDKLYIVERFGVVVYDLKTDKVSDKFYIKTSYFLNDVTVGSDGSIYVSESDTNVIYRIKGRNVEKWLDSEEISRPNGILFDDGKLLAAVNSDHYLKAINISDKKVTKIANLGEGILDGIKKCGDGYLVSDFMGNLYLVKSSGQVAELINTRDAEINIADFEYIADKDMVVVPAMRKNKLICYRLGQAEKTD